MLLFGLVIFISLNSINFLFTGNSGALSFIDFDIIIEFDDDVTIELHGDKPDLQIGLKEMGSFFLED